MGIIDKHFDLHYRPSIGILKEPSIGILKDPSLGILKETFDWHYGQALRLALCQGLRSEFWKTFSFGTLGQAFQLACQGILPFSIVSRQLRQAC